MTKLKNWVLVGAMVFISCTASIKSTQQQEQPANIPVNGKLFSTAFMQTAGEYRAMCYQTYHFARLSLDNMMLTGKYARPVIVTDIDETILNNSAYEAHRTLKGLDYSVDSWYEWTSKSAADTIPGALGFFQHAASKGVEAFYITNRDERERAATLKNLVRFGFPNADSAHLLLRENTSSKESRRQRLMQDHTILMLLGDNLADLHSLFDKKSVAERNNNVDQLSGEFGIRYIVLPNPIYGDWESALYQYNHKLSTAQKDSILRGAVREY